MTTIDPNSKLDRIYAINGLRGLAILAVIFTHLPIHAWFVTKFYYVFNHFNTGVMLFFMLSGFVLYRPFLLKKINYLSFNEVKDFYVKRFFRLYPLFFLNCIILFLFYHKPSVHMLKSMVGALSTYSLFFGKDYMPVINWVLWSLMVEIWFSIFFPLILWFVHKISISNLTFCAILFSTICRFLMRYYADFLGHSLSVFKNIDYFIIGMWICHIYYNRSDYFFKLNRSYLLLVGVFCLLVACLMLDFKLPSYIQIFSNVFFQFGFGLMVFVGLKKSGKFNAFLSFRPLQLAGMMCFSLYVWHGTLIFLLIRVEFHAVDYLYYFIGVSLLSAFTYRFVEFRSETSLKKLFLF